MLNEDYKDILLALNEERVDYIIVGAYALAVHGYPRATMDIDIWVRPSAINAEAVLKALKKFGAPLLNLTKVDLTKNDTIFQIGIAPRRIDIITGASGLSFAAASENALEVIIEGIKVKVLSINDLIKNKQASGRPKDLIDAETLQAKARDKDKK